MKLLLDKESTVEVCSDDVAVREILASKINAPGREDKDDAFFICDIGDIIKKHKKFQHYLPQVQPFYAIKCNADPTVVQLIASLGIGFDCASKSEIEQVLGCGVQPEKIIFANPCKQASHLRYAASRGVSMMTFDNEHELHKIKDIYPTADLVIRIRVDDSKALCQLGIKYGVSISNATALLEKAHALGLNVIGVSFHVGSGCYDAKAFYEAVRSARFIFDEAEKVGYQFSLLDVGGGFPGDNTAKVSFAETAACLKKAFDDFFPPSCGIRIIAEPGRYFVASAFTIACNIISKRTVHSDCSQEGTDGFMYYVNDGVYGSFNCILFDHVQPKAVPLELPEGNKLFKSSIWGPTCDSMDCINKCAMLPKLDIGDWLYFENMGAYTLSAASTFNGFSKPVVQYVVRNSYCSFFTDLYPRAHERKKKYFVHEDSWAAFTLSATKAGF